MSKPRIVVTRHVYPEALDHLAPHFNITHNQEDKAYSLDEWMTLLSQQDGALTMGIEPVNEQVLSACPKLRICANLSVGYNNFDVPAMTRHKVVATNAPDVLTETTADFCFALMMATARRITEGENYIRRGDWHKWKLDFFAAQKCMAARWASSAWGALAKPSHAAQRTVLA
jgi:gluconate 2-dehydrogenase